MLEDDLAHQRTRPTSEVVSILDFGRFLQTAALDADIAPKTLPVEHVGFYRGIVERLIAARELPVHTMERFDTTFAAGFFKTLAV